MIYEIGDIIKYNFPNPKEHEKNYIIGKIVKSNLEKVVIQCIDNTRLVISFKNYDRIELLAGAEILE